MNYRSAYVTKCCYARGEHTGKWIVQTYHQSGNPWSDDQCRHYTSRKYANEAVRRIVIDALMYREDV